MLRGLGDGRCPHALASGSKDLIVVMPNALTKFGGSMYSTSVTIGDWETYIATELVSYIDMNYRTLASADSRGLAGHSMGGYGALRIGMKHPEVFSAIYALSPCCLIPPTGPAPGAGRGGAADAIATFEELEKADFGIKAQLASAAAWSPNPNNPPFFVDLAMKDGEPQPLVLAKLAANAPPTTSTGSLNGWRSRWCRSSPQPHVCTVGASLLQWGSVEPP